MIPTALSAQVGDAVNAGSAVAALVVRGASEIPPLLLASPTR
jgi:hypothetical protein